VKKQVVSALVAFAAGALFAIGLVVSGMTDPAKVRGFLDVAGDWDPSLALVMVGGIGTHFVLRRLILRRAAPVASPTFADPAKAPIDAKLLAGSALFGVGWGLAGYCPGPAIVTAGAAGREGLLFVLAMAGGILLHRLVRARPAPAAEPRSTPQVAAPLAASKPIDG
jgi:uncharacterized membrane protein YedE/YeeE